MDSGISPAVKYVKSTKKKKNKAKQNTYCFYGNKSRFQREIHLMQHLIGKTNNNASCLILVCQNRTVTHELRIFIFILRVL